MKFERKNVYTFMRSFTEDMTTGYTENTYVGPEGEPWPLVMLHFATFLESCGYVGVYERVEQAFEDML